jgi:phosphoesterase RecJ-like protein
MTEKRIPDKVLSTIKNHSHFLLMTHVQPDGDAIGSLLATADILDGMGKRVFAYLEEPVSHLFKFMPGKERTDTDLANLDRFIRQAGRNLCAVALDCGEIDRLGPIKDRLSEISPFLVIDHHLSHANFGDCRWVEPTCSSTGEMVYEISEALGLPLSREAAFALYTAISTDTGSFRYECTGARTLEIASKLVACGVKPDQVSAHLYDNFSPARIRLMQMVLATLHLCAEDRIAFIHVTSEMFEQTGALPQDIEGFVEYPRAIASVRVAVFIKQIKADKISASLRAKGDCNVATVAKLFGGGGHRNAAGCKFSGVTIESVQKKLRQSITDRLDHPTQEELS